MTHGWHLSPHTVCVFKMVNINFVVENRQHWRHKEPHVYGLVTSDIKKLLFTVVMILISIN